MRRPKPLEWTRAELESAKTELGVTDTHIQQLLSRPSIEAAQEGLDDLKAQAKQSWKKLALKYHPDKNPDDPEATRRFRLLKDVLDALNELQVARRPPPPQVAVGVRFVQVHFNNFSGFGGSSTTSSTTGWTSYSWTGSGWPGTGGF